MCRERLKEIAELVTPDTLLRWYRKLIAAKYDGSQRRGPERPRVMETIRELVLTMAKENSGWGYTRICGALANMGREVGRNTVKRILAEKGNRVSFAFQFSQSVCLGDVDFAFRLSFGTLQVSRLPSRADR